LSSEAVLGVRSALEWAQVRALVADGVSEREVARRLGINRRTVARLVRSKEPPRYWRPATGSKVDPFEPVLRRLLAEWPHINAPRATELLREEYGYDGSVDLVKRRLRELRPRAVRPAQRTGYRPGQVLQFDWAEMPTRPTLAGRERRVYALVASLPYSGAQTAFFSVEMTLEAFLEGHVRALEWLGGVPRECVYDNLRSVVARREGDEVVWNRRFVHLRGHDGFHASPCTPATPREKGSVEAAVRYLKSGFWPARRFRSLVELDEQYAGWRDRVCNRRLHATRRLRVDERLAEERAALRPLAPARFDWSGHRSSGCRWTGTCAKAAASTVHRSGWCTSGSSSVSTATRSGSCIEVSRSPLPAQLRAGRLAAAADHAAGAASGGAAACAAAADGRGAGARRLRGAVRVSPAKAKPGERLRYPLSKLKAPRVLERLEQTAALAREQEWPYERFLETLLEAEVFARDASGARMRIRQAGLPALKTLEDFDWSAQPSAEKPLVLHLAQLAWIEERANVCFFGPPGTGKTHLAIALGIRACLAGQRVAFATATEWVARLGDAQRQGRLGEELRKLLWTPLLIVDEVGYIPFDPAAANLMFSLVSSRYERASLIVTSNKAFSAWGEIFGDETVAAMIDRLVHHAEIHSLKGDSYRLRDRDLGGRPPARGPETA
jgi:DNA replication protein DnaC/transposase